ncbi:MAG: hypothetical protein LUC47_08140 [Clostridiales bacterium]|nr:hypothetical protein [Clostridiales bacterium]
MSQNYDALRSDEAAALLGDREKLKALLQSPETKRLMELLRNQNGDKLKDAAQQARQGDAASLTAMMQKLMDTGEGAALVSQIEGQIPKKK